LINKHNSPSFARCERLKNVKIHFGRLDAAFATRAGFSEIFPFCAKSLKNRPKPHFNPLRIENFGEEW
jgi:hypothetical protein